MRGVVDFRAAPLVWPPACALEPPSPLPPRMRCAARLMRSPTPFAFFGASSSPSSLSVLAARVVLAADQLDVRDLGGIPAAETDPKNPRVAAGPLREPRRERFEQLADHFLVRQLGQHHPARVQGLAVGLRRRDPAPRDGDQPFDERPQLLRLRHRGLDLLVTQQCDGLVAQQREPMLGDAAKLPMCDVVSHDELCWLWAVGSGSGRVRHLPTVREPGLQPRASSVLMRLRGLIEPHAQAQPHRVQDLLDLVERLAAEVLRLQHLRLGLLHELADGSDVRVLQAVVRPH